MHKICITKILEQVNRKLVNVRDYEIHSMNQIKTL